MDTGMRSLIIVNGKDRTDSVVSCKYVGSKCNIVYDNSTKVFSFINMGFSFTETAAGRSKYGV